MAKASGLAAAVLMTLAGGFILLRSFGQQDPLAWVLILAGGTLAFLGTWMCVLWVITRKDERCR